MPSKFLLPIALLLLLAACSESLTETDLPLPEPPHNPYDDIDYDPNDIPEIPVDSHSFLGLHYYIFSRYCNQPGCHDGTFEPDFRTVLSAYNSLVLHPVTKNYPTGPLPYRVTPGEPAASMLYHRLTIQNPPNFERMPASGNPLPDNLLQLIEEWIENGAPDIYGNLPMQTSAQPSCYGVAAFLPDVGDLRIDTMRNGVFFNPFLAPVDENIELWFLLLDVTPEGDTIPSNTLTYNRIRFSTDPLDFSGAVERNLTVPFFPELIASVLSQPFPVPLPYYQNVTVKPSDLGFQPGEVVYMRVYVKDSDHDVPTEIPESDSLFPLLTYFAFVVQ